MRYIVFLVGIATFACSNDSDSEGTKTASCLGVEAGPTCTLLIDQEIDEDYAGSSLAAYRVSFRTAESSNPEAEALNEYSLFFALDGNSNDRVDQGDEIKFCPIEAQAASVPSQGEVTFYYAGILPRYVPLWRGICADGERVSMASTSED